VPAIQYLLTSSRDPAKFSEPAKNRRVGSEISVKEKKASSRDSLQERIFGLLRESSHALHAGELRSILGLKKSEHAGLLEELGQMVEAGLIAELAGGKYRARRKGARAKLPKATSAEPPTPRPLRGRDRRNTRVGRLGINARGFGFVVTEEPGPDVFVPPRALGNAFNGDKVRVRIFTSPKGLDGQVVEIVERAVQFIGGQLRSVAGATFIEADDERLKAHIQVVGPLPPGARSGKSVIAKIVGYPKTPGEPILASVVESFDPATLAEFEIRRTLLSQGVKEEFSAEALAEAEALPEHLTPEEYAQRVDLRKLELVTIDPEDARDHDDAVWAERQPDGGYRVVVAIADVSHYVRPGTALDRDALARGCTIYLPSRAIAMLPNKLSSDLASLVPHKDRLALAVDIALDAKGQVVSYRFVECVMRSAARLSYEGVARALGLTTAPTKQPAAESRRTLLDVLLEISKLLAIQRRNRGSLEFDLPEAKVKLDPKTAEPIDVERSRKDPGVRIAYNMIEELMLLANEVVAGDLSARGVPAIYRVHGVPNQEKVLAFAELARSLGFVLDEDAAERPEKLARFLTGVSGTAHAEVLSYLLLRAMQQATYSTDNIGHFGLASKDYLHFTSPIRRYPDLAVHRLVRKIARSEPIRGKKLKSELAQQASESSLLERRAMLVEREVVDLYRALLMRERVGEELDATVTGITEHGIYAAVDAPFVDVFCRMSALPADRYETDRYGTKLCGQRSGICYALFDRIKVRIEDVSISLRKISAVPVGVTEVQPSRLGSATASARSSKRPKNPKQAPQGKSRKGREKRRPEPPSPRQKRKTRNPR
jgi:ribonuclease R